MRRQSHKRRILVVSAFNNAGIRYNVSILNREMWWHSRLTERVTRMPGDVIGIWQHCGCDADTRLRSSLLPNCISIHMRAPRRPSTSRRLCGATQPSLTGARQTVWFASRSTSQRRLACKKADRRFMVTKLEAALFITCFFWHIGWIPETIMTTCACKIV
jgi:hypothetical protein